MTRLAADDLVHHRVSGYRARDVEWAVGRDMRIPAALHAALMDDAPADVAEQARAAAPALREIGMFTDALPVSSRLPFSYQLIPGLLRRAIASAIGRAQRHRQRKWARFPGWPVDLSADYVADLAGTPRTMAAGPTPVILSHDLDSLEGLRNLVSLFLPLEEAVGARSTNFFVPCAWPLDHGLLAEVTARGHELGIHGYDHSNRTPFVGESERLSRLGAARPLLEKYKILGYRAPSLVRTRALLADLAGLYRFDSSIPTSGGPFPVPNNGCASARPFEVFGLWEIPVSMPRDGTLRFLGHSPAEILEIWKDCAEAISRAAGVVVLLTHCEEAYSGNPKMLDVMHGFLEFLAADNRYAFTCPSIFLNRLRSGS